MVTIQDLIITVAVISWAISLIGHAGSFFDWKRSVDRRLDALEERKSSIEE